MSDEEMICCICGKKIADNEPWNACDQGFTCESCSAKCPPKCQPPCKLKS